MQNTNWMVTEVSYLLTLFLEVSDPRFGVLEIDKFCNVTLQNFDFY
jgi:hypothetical protein